MNFDFTGLITLSVSFGLATLFGLLAVVAFIGLLSRRRSPPSRKGSTEPWKAYLATSLGFAIACPILAVLSLRMLPRTWLHHLDDTCGYWAPLPTLLFLLVVFNLRRTRKTAVTEERQPG